MITVEIGPDSTISYTAPDGLKIGRNRTLEIDVSDYISENSAYTVSCGDATGVDNTKLTGVTHSGSSCTFTVDPINTLASGSQGDTTFTIPLTSTGGHTLDATLTVNIGPDSTITFTAPPTSGAGSLLVGTNRTLRIDASDYVTEAHSGYAITCGNATNISNEIDSIVRDSGTCSYDITPKLTATQGAVEFTVPYTSAGGHALAGTITVNIGADSTISYTAPPTSGAGSLIVPISTSKTIDVSSYATDGAYTITCGDAINLHSRIESVTHTGTSCSYEVTAGAIEGSASFNVPYKSTGGHEMTALVRLTIGPTSAIQFSAPTGLQVNIGSTITIDASNYVTDGPYDITCGTATGVSLTSVVQSASDTTGCTYVVTPSSTGSGTFTVPYTSSGGDALPDSGPPARTSQISISIYPASSISFTAPTGLSVSAGNSITVDASSATDANPTYTVSCGNVTSSHERINSITRTGCEYEIRAGSEAGTASFSFELISRDSGGTIQSTGNFQITITITELSNIIFTVPTDLVVQAGSAIIINAADYATDGSYTITCGDAVASSLVSVTRTADTCTYTATAAASTTVVPLSAGFSVPYTSSGGDSYNGRINITINPTSNIIFTAPTDLEIGAGNTRTVNLLAGYATDTIYTITCGNATASDTARLTLIERNGCDYTITAAADATQGDTTLTLTYTSTCLLYTSPSPRD